MCDCHLHEGNIFEKKVGFSLKFLVVTGRCGVAAGRFEVLDRKTAFNLFKPCRGLVDAG